MNFPFPRFLPLAALLLGLAACSLPPAQSDPTRYYVLTPAAARASDSAPVGTHWRVALRPVEVPNFLRGKTMAVRVASNEVVYVDEARWAETLEAGIGRVLRESLEKRPEVAFVATGGGEDHDFDIAVRVLRCEGDREKGVARFTAAVEIYSAGPGGARRGRDIFTTEVPDWNRQDYGQLAAKLSEAVDAFGDRIIALLASVQKP
ncbi:MAG: membrane integrity-associated transporter subunit PqiC [Verrucomicrobia bacterium]|nr:membrane integrity-associated transporter subunit PqiC [Verrucomicrobiota bacterium]